VGSGAAGDAAGFAGAGVCEVRRAFRARTQRAGAMTVDKPSYRFIPTKAGQSLKATDQSSTLPRRPFISTVPWSLRDIRFAISLYLVIRSSVA